MNNEYVSTELPSISFKRTKKAEHFIVEETDIKVTGHFLEEAMLYFKVVLKLIEEKK